MDEKIVRVYLSKEEAIDDLGDFFDSNELIYSEFRRRDRNGESLDNLTATILVELFVVKMGDEDEQFEFTGMEISPVDFFSSSYLELDEPHRSVSSDFVEFVREYLAKGGVGKFPNVESIFYTIEGQRVQDYRMFTDDDRMFMDGDLEEVLKDVEEIEVKAARVVLVDFFNETGKLSAPSKIVHRGFTQEERKAFEKLYFSK